ncbi:SDR family oxidoreductase [Streptomyces sp. NBC_00448]|uniref:SDR family oxidoreductase n=1 Tax=Streptomyces sp. NBC_00448 TaxID=2903652 RepID=UPI002E22E7C8
MHVFVTGGSGLTGPTVVAELVAAGHKVTGLARSDASAARLEGLGATVHRGSLEDLDSLRAGAEAADGVLHMAFGGDFADPEDLIRRDRTAIEALGGALTDSGKPFVSTSGTLVMPVGRVSGEQDAPDPASIGAFRIPGERACLGSAARGVRASLVRLAPTVHGPGDYGFVPMLVAAARKTGTSAYIGTGANRWPAVHRADAARLFRLALESAPAGSVLHGAAEGGVAFKSIAETIGRMLGLPTASLAPEEAAEHFGNPFMARVFGIDAPVSSDGTRQLLGWTPTHPTLLEDLEHGDYFTPSAA